MLLICCFDHPSGNLVTDMATGSKCGQVERSNMQDQTLFQLRTRLSTTLNHGMTLSTWFIPCLFSDHHRVMCPIGCWLTHDNLVRRNADWLTDRLAFMTFVGGCN